MAKVRIIRVLEYIGDEDWLRVTLEKSAVKEDTRLVIPNGEIAELSRTEQEIIVDDDPASAPSVCGAYKEYVGDGIGCDFDPGHEGNHGKKADRDRRRPK